MAQRKISDTVRSLNAKYGSHCTYQKFFLAIVDGRVPAKRDASGRFWLIDEADEPLIARTLGLVPAEQDATPSMPARPRTSIRRSAA
jgi:hypothetical protein